MENTKAESVTMRLRRRRAKGFEWQCRGYIEEMDELQGRRTHLGASGPNRQGHPEPDGGAGEPGTASSRRCRSPTSGDPTRAWQTVGGDGLPDEGMWTVHREGG